MIGSIGIVKTLAVFVLVRDGGEEGEGLICIWLRPALCLDLIYDSRETLQREE